MVKYDKCYFYAGYKLLNVKNINLKVSSRIFKKLRKPGRNKSNCFLSGLHPMYSLCNSVLDKFHN